MDGEFYALYARLRISSKIDNLYPTHLFKLNPVLHYCYFFLLHLVFPLRRLPNGLIRGNFDVRAFTAYIGVDAKILEEISVWTSATNYT